MPAGQVVAVWESREIRRAYDDMFKWSYLTEDEWLRSSAAVARDEQRVQEMAHDGRRGASHGGHAVAGCVRRQGG